MNKLTEGQKQDLKSVLNLLKAISKETNGQANEPVRMELVDTYHLYLQKIENIISEKLQFLRIPDSASSVNDWYEPSIFRSNLAQLIALAEDKLGSDGEILEIGVAISAINDIDIRDRCLGLLTINKNFDTVIREATTILEDKIRKKSALDSNLVGVNLVNKALNPNDGVLEIDGDKYEKEGYFQLFRGVMLAFRDSTHHKISDDFNREDAIKVISSIDVLLNVLKKAKKKSIVDV